MEIRRKMDEKEESIKSILNDLDTNTSMLTLKELENLEYDLNKMLYKYNIKK